MDTVFIKLLNMSITASWLVLAVVLLRLFLKKAPKWIRCVLWGLVGIRLVCPFSFESVLSIIPSAEPIPQNITITENPAINSGLPIVNQIVNPFLAETFSPAVGASVNPMQIAAAAASVIWIIGVIGMLLYALISYLRLRIRIREAIPLRDGILLCDRISAPFILGVLRPRICLPSSMDQADTEYVISHERAHLKRKDHIWKPLGFLLLSVYWFNPVLWAGYILLCKDIELACDEKVIRDLGIESKKPYSDALINCSTPRRMIAACPLAFGETGVKERIKSVLHYKKPAFWMILAAVCVCVTAAACLLTNPLKSTQIPDDLAVFLEEQIAEYHKSDKTKDNLICIDYEPLKVEKRGDKITVYAWVLYEEFSCSNKLKLETGAHTPTAVTVQKTDGGYQLKEYWTPRGGSLYAGDIRNKFPDWLWVTASDGQRYIKKQKANCLKKAMEYYEISDPVSSAPDRQSYLFRGSVDPVSPWLELSQDGSFVFTFSSLSSQCFGTYERTEDKLILKSNNGNNTYVFKADENAFLFLAKESIAIPTYRYSPDGELQSPVPDGAKFILAGAFSDDNPSVAVSYAGYTDDPQIYMNALNREQLSVNRVQHLPIYKFESKRELDQFKADFGNVFSMSQSYDEVPSFNETVQKYDSSFFVENRLFLVYVPASSGSLRFGVNSMVINDNDHSICIHVQQENDPEVGTMDMCGWFITYEFDKQSAPYCTEFDADMVQAEGLQ